MNPLPEDNRPRHPTIGPGYEVQKDAERHFEDWLPKRWLPRKEIPDVHVDFCVEAVNEGEPSGSLFRVQVKGRSIYKRKAKKLAEPFKTKHLRYYLKCEEPVFLFLIDPTAKQGHWIFIQRYLKENVKDDILRVQTKLRIPFDAQRSLENWALFEKELRDAWNYIRELRPGSPQAAIIAEKKRLEQLHPGHSVKIEATMKVQVKLLQPLAGGLKAEFLKNVGADEWKAFIEKGHSFQVKAAELQGSAIPINLYQTPEDARITIRSGNRLRGCLHFLFNSETQPLCLQIDGEWVLAAKEVSFAGRLNDSPLRMDCIREQDESGKLKPWETIFNLDWGAWEGQALQALAWFVELGEFFKRGEFVLRSYLKGFQPWPPEKLMLDNAGLKPPIEAMDCLHKCRRVAEHIGVNPPFPKANALQEIQSDDVRLLVKFMESGGHEQSNVGQTVGLAVGNPYTGPKIGEKGLTANFPEPCRIMNFFGLEICFGPLAHTWTDLELIVTHPADEDRTEMIFKGGANSIWKIEYKRPPQPGLLPTEKENRAPSP